MSVFCFCCKKRDKAPSTEEAPPPPSPVIATPKPVKLPDIPIAAPISFTPIKIPAATTSKTSLPPTGSIAGAPIEPAEVGEIVSDGSDIAASPDNANKSHTTLDYVKNRFRKHLSGDSSTNHSANCSTNNDENVARRAEVRRLMHQRIQQELQHEDASVADKSDHQSSKRHSLIYTGDTPGGGPRDQVEFSVEQMLVSPVSKVDSKSPGTPQEVSDLSDEPPEAVEEHPADCRRASCPDCFRDERRPSYAPPARHVAMKDRGSMPEMRPSPEQTTSAPPSEVESGRAKPGQFKLGGDDSHGTTPVIHEDSEEETRPNGELGRRPVTPTRAVRHSRTVPSLLSSFNGSPERRVVSATRDESPMRTWLWSQGLYSPARSPQRSFDTPGGSGDEGCTIHEAQAVKLAKPHTTINDLDGAASGRRSPVQESVHLQDMSISRQLETDLGSPQARHRPSLDGLKERDHSNVTLASHISSLSLPPNAILVGNESKENEALFSNFANNSSVYSPAKQDSERGSPANLGFKFANIIAGRKGGQASHSSKYAAEAKRRISSGASSYQTAPRAVSGPGLPVASFHNGRDSESQQASETSSFKRRDAELKTIDARFADSHLRRGPSTPVMSKFTEGFEEAEPGSSANRSSILSKLHLSLPKKARLSSKGNDIEEIADATTASAPNSRLPSLNIAHKASGFFMPPFSRMSSKTEKGETSSEMLKETQSPAAQDEPVDGKGKGPALRTSDIASSSTRTQQPQLPAEELRSRKEARHSIPGKSISAAARSRARMMKQDDVISRSLLRSSEIVEEWTQRMENQTVEAKYLSTSAGQAEHMKRSLSLAKPATRHASHPAAVDVMAAAAQRARHMDGPSQATLNDEENGMLSGDAAHRDQDQELSGTRVLSNRFGQAVRRRMSKLIRKKEENTHGDEGGDKSTPSKAQLSIDGGEGWEMLSIPTEGGMADVGLNTEMVTAAAGAPSTGHATGSSDYDQGTSNMGSRTTELFSAPEVETTPATPASSEDQQRNDKHLEEPSSPAAYATPASRMSLCNDVEDIRSKFLDVDGTVESIRSALHMPTEKPVADGEDSKSKTWHGRSKSHKLRRNPLNPEQNFEIDTEALQHRAKSLASLTAGGSKEV